MAIDISGVNRVEVVGESYYRPALREISERGAGPYEATLVCDPTNPYDRNAVKVIVAGRQVGHLPREFAALVSGRIGELAAANGEVTCSAEIRGSGGEIGQGVILAVDLGQLNLINAEDAEPSVLISEDLDGATVLASAGEAAGATSQPQPEVGSVGADAVRRKVVERAVERWKSELIDLTARNRLLYMRDLKTGTLSFDSTAREALMQLVAGHKVTLSKLVPRGRLPESPSATLTPFEDAVRRMRAIVRTGRSYEEERGVRTLFLACGVATWQSDRASRPPAAPVLLVPLSIRARGASQQDFDLSLAGELEVNPTLLHMLKVEFNLEINDQELYDHADMDGVIDTPEELRLTYNWLSEKCASVPGWAIADRFILGNFWYAKLPMVKDLESSIETLATHDVAAALAGDSQARQALAEARRGTVAANPPLVDEISPGSEFNVLDSDSSQSLAVARVSGGESLVIKGPPGTGKSQTIANLICDAIASGRRVLFVAEKRAAIEAVTKRLDGADLGDLVLDLHQGAESRKWLAGQLDVSLEAVRLAENVPWKAEEGRLIRARESLKAHAGSLHMKHAPWGVSVIEAEYELIARGRPSVSSRARGGDLEAIDQEQLAELGEALRDLVAVKGLSLRANASPWSEAAIDSSELAREAMSLVEEAGDLVARTESGLAAAAASTGFPPPPNLAAARSAIEIWAAAQALSEVFEPMLFEEDLDTLGTTLEPLGGSSFSRLMAALTSSDFRAARSVVQVQTRQGRNLDPAQLYEGLLACRNLRDSWKDLGGRGTPAAPAEIDALRAALIRLEAICKRLGELIGRNLLSLSFNHLRSEIDVLRSDRDTAMILPSIHAARRRFDSVGLADFLKEMEERQELLLEAQEELERVWWQSLADHLLMLPESEGISAFRGERHDEVLAAFRELDRNHVAAAARRVKRISAEAAVRAQDRHPEQAQLVREQAKRKRRHMPVRELFTKAPDVLTALRPCWVMSPLMVSQLIPSERAYFDLVVFDEASQVRPVDALTSMIRGTQLVVAGDNHQLPPTAFFDATAVVEDAEEDKGATELADYESLLDVLMTLFDTEMLRWHYRSRDERLIGFSNHEIYDSGLTTFPGVVHGEVLSHVYVDETPGPEEARVSPDAEVRRVVELVLEHARKRPDESLGVIALGINHAEAIEAGLLAVLPNYPELEVFFEEEKEERFFVKNLERVQGDERDAIILAIGYGKLPDGDLPHRFGPLNNAGGERRLNVAVTRAKRRMTVVSSFKADDIDPKRSSAAGVRLLQAFLAYADRGGEADGAVAPVEPTALHRLIASSLDAAGYEALELMGSSVDRIDVAVVDPAEGIPKVAIEVDGLAYAQRPSVRDRDRLRPEQLERLGWRHVSSWSQDWYRDPAGTAQRLAEKVRYQLNREANSSEGEDPENESGAHGGSPIRPRGPRPSLSSGGPAITDWRLHDLLALAKWIESDGLLRTGDELERELMVELGINRRGSRVARVLGEVVSRLRGDASQS